MVAPTLATEEYQLDDDGVGVLLNGGVAMPFVDITSVKGLDSAQARVQVTAREGLDGSWVDATYEIERAVILEGKIYTDNTALETYLDSLKANWALSPTNKPLYFGTDAGVRCVFGKPQGLRYSKESLRRLGCVEAQFIVTCGDPRIYSPTVVSQNLPGTAVLGGNRKTPPVIRINGARTNPSLTLGGKTMTITYTLPGANYIDIDVVNRTAMLNGTINIRSVLSFSAGAVWNDFMLSPGNNVFTVGGTGAGTITLTARSAWR